MELRCWTQTLPEAYRIHNSGPLLPRSGKFWICHWLRGVLHPLYPQDQPLLLVQFYWSYVLSWNNLIFLKICKWDYCFEWVPNQSFSVIIHHNIGNVYKHWVYIEFSLNFHEFNSAQQVRALFPYSFLEIWTPLCEILDLSLFKRCLKKLPQETIILVLPPEVYLSKLDFCALYWIQVYTALTL